MASAWVFAAVASLALLAAGGSARADTLFFFATKDINGILNYNWFSPSNWYYAVPAGGYTNANAIPGAGDNAFVMTAANAAGNQINLASLVLEPGIIVSGGGFVAGQVAMTAGSRFSGSTIEVQAQMYISGACGVTMGQLGIDAGAYCQFYGPQAANGPGTLTLTMATLYNEGELILTNMSGVTGSGDLVNRGGYISSSGMASITSTGTFDNSGTVRAYNGTLEVGPFAAWLSSSGVGIYQALATNAVIQFAAPGPTIPAGATNIFSGPGTNDLPDGGTVDGVLQVGGVDPTTQVLVPGQVTLSSEGVVLGGAGIAYVLGNSSAGSVLDWMGGTISLAEVDIDSGGQFNLGGSADKFLSGATVNNSGVTTTVSDGVALHLDAGSGFNNLAGGLFDAQNDSAISGSAGATPGVFNNAGTFRKSAGTNATFFSADSSPSQGPFFNNSGLLDVETEVVRLLTGTNTGQFNVAAGTRIGLWGGTNAQQAGANFTGSGQIELAAGSGATLFLDTNIVLQNFLFDGNDVVDGPGDLTVNGTFTWSQGTIQGSGALNLGASAVLSVPAGVSLTRTLNNSGTAQFQGGAVLAGNGISWNNLAGAVVDLAAAGSYTALDYTGSGGRPSFANAGTVSNSAGAFPTIDWAFTNAGLVWIRPTGTTFQRGFTQTAGTCQVDSGATLGAPYPGAILIEGGVLMGTGTVASNVANSGTVQPGDAPGILQIGGSFFTNLAGGVVAIQIGGRTPGTGYSQLAGVNGSPGAVLGGTLAVSFVNGFLPSLGDSYSVLTFPTLLAQSSFAAITGARAGNGLVLVPVYSPTIVSLVAVYDPVMTRPVVSNHQFSFSFPSTAGFTNVIEFTDSLSAPVWQTLTTIPGDGTLKPVLDSIAGVPARFYRVGFQ